MQKYYTKFLIKIGKSSVLGKKIQTPNEMSLKPGVPKGKPDKKKTKQTKRQKPYT